jgi:dTDP-4-dehydrorhamnose 3,5-epimerase-like enzyme
MDFIRPRVLSYDVRKDDFGKLRIIESQFDIKRVYSIEGVPQNASRGFHAHKSLKQAFFMLRGEMRIRLSIPSNEYNFRLSSESNEILLVHPGYWRILDNFSPDALCLVLASESFEENDYIRDYKEYVKWHQEQTNK